MLSLKFNTFLAMENKSGYPENEKHTQSDQQDDAEFENPSVDPGFETGEELSGEEDEREGNIDSDKSVSDMKKDQQNDALNYKNDRENGAYNPKNI